MNDQHLSNESRRSLEERATRLAEQRADLETRLLFNTRQIVDLMHESVEAGIAVEAFARLMEVSRETLQRWQEAAGRHRLRTR